MIGFLIGIVFIIIILWACKIVFAYMELPPPMQQLLLVVIGLVLLLGLIGHGVYDPFGTGYGWR